MDTERFDRLVKSLSTVRTRCRLLRLVSPVPVAGALLTRLEEVVQGQCEGADVRGGGGRLAPSPLMSALSFSIRFSICRARSCPC
jgi:hypothetical protein